MGVRRTILTGMDKKELVTYLEGIAQAVELLPSPFTADPLIRDNLNNLKADMALWGLG